MDKVPIELGIGNVQEHHIIPTRWWYQSENFMKEIAVRIEQGVSLAGGDVLLEHDAQQVRLAGSGFPNGVEMRTPVSLAYAERSTGVAVVNAANVRDAVV